MRCLWKLTTSALWSEGAGDQCLPGTWRAEPSSSHPLISSASMQVAGSFKEVKEALIWFRFTVVGKTHFLFFFSECEPELLNLLGFAKSPASYLWFSVCRCLVFTKERKEKFPLISQYFWILWIFCQALLKWRSSGVFVFSGRLRPHTNGVYTRTRLKWNSETSMPDH